jgi:type IV pilus assembly protein PilM
MLKIPKLFAQKAKGIGLEVTADKINIAQVSKQGQQYKLVKNLSVDLPEGIFQEGHIVNAIALAEIIKETLTENKISTKNVATALPMREAIMRMIPIPAELDEKELRDLVLNQEANMNLPYSREEVDLDYQKLNYFMDKDGIEKVNVLLVATKKEVTDLYIDTFQQAGLEIDVLEINSFALIRTIREQLRQFGSKEAVVLIDIEFDSTEIVIIVDGIPQYSRTIGIGTLQLQSALAQGMNLPVSRSTELLQGISLLAAPLDKQTSGTGATWINPGMASLLRVLGELIEELGRSINFYLNQNNNLEIAQLLLAGPGAGIGQIDDFFSQRLNIPTMQIDPIVGLALQVEEEIPMPKRPSLGTVLGLGMREV